MNGVRNWFKHAEADAANIAKRIENKADDFIQKVPFVKVMNDAFRTEETVLEDRLKTTIGAVEDIARNSVSKNLDNVARFIEGHMGNSDTSSHFIDPPTTPEDKHLNYLARIPLPGTDTTPPYDIAPSIQSISKVPFTEEEVLSAIPRGNSRSDAFASSRNARAKAINSMSINRNDGPSKTIGKPIQSKRSGLLDSISSAEAKAFSLASNLAENMYSGGKGLIDKVEDEAISIAGVIKDQGVRSWPFIREMGTDAAVLLAKNIRNGVPTAINMIKSDIDIVDSLPGRAIDTIGNVIGYLPRKIIGAEKVMANNFVEAGREIKHVMVWIAVVGGILLVVYNKEAVKSASYVTRKVKNAAYAGAKLAPLFI